MITRQYWKNLKEKLEKFVEDLNEKELDSFVEMLEGDDKQQTVDKKKAYIIEALPGNKTRIIEDDA